MSRLLWLGCIVILVAELSADRAWAQGAAQAELVVPTFGIFTAGTTISVPDRGYSGVGGLRGSTDSRVEFGPNFERGFASRRSASDAATRVWIHDFQEMERGLAAAAGGGSKPVRPPEGFAARMFDYTSSDHEPKETKPARESRPQAVTGKPNDDSDASFKLAHSEDLLKRAQQAEERGKLKVAALYYKSVVSLGVSPNATVAKQRLAAIESKLASR